MFIVERQIIQDKRRETPWTVLKIKGPHQVVLRDILPQDVEDIIHWNTVEKEWMEWDAPWEKSTEFDSQSFRIEAMDRILEENPAKRLRKRMEIEVSGEHVGLVSHYPINADYEATEKGEEIAVGILLIPQQMRAKGVGTIALAMYIRYLLQAGYETVHCQTWSGNRPMLGLAKKLGFMRCMRKPGLRTVRGEKFDGLTFRLDRGMFEEAWSRLEANIVAEGDQNLRAQEEKV